MPWIDLMIKILADYKQSSGWDNPLYFRELSKLTDRQARTLSLLLVRFASDVKSQNKCDHKRYEEKADFRQRICLDCGAEQFGSYPDNNGDQDAFIGLPMPLEWGLWE